jgi:hypothetical protein
LSHSPKTPCLPNSTLPHPEMAQLYLLCPVVADLAVSYISFVVKFVERTVIPVPLYIA